MIAIGSQANTTAAYAEMARYIDQGLSAARVRNIEAQLDLFRRAADLAMEANLGSDVIVGTRRNLALALRGAGRLPAAQEIYRQLLAFPDLPAGQRPFVLHGLGITLALAGSPEAPALLAEAISSYAKRRDRLQAALDLAEFWLEHQRPDTAYTVCREQLLPSDQQEFPDLACQAEITLARAATARSDRASAADHLQRAKTIQAEANLTALRPLIRAVGAELAYHSGGGSQARTELLLALEEAMSNTEQNLVSSVFQTVARIVDRVFHAVEGEGDEA